MAAFRLFRIIAVAVLLPAQAIRRAPTTRLRPRRFRPRRTCSRILSPDMIAQLTAQITNAFWPVVEQKARADKIDDATIAELRREFERIQIAFVTEAMKDAPPIYARHFTVAELHELSAFYRTPIGAKALHEMPQVMGEFTTRSCRACRTCSGEPARRSTKSCRRTAT